MSLCVLVQFGKEKNKGREEGVLSIRWESQERVEGYVFLLFLSLRPPFVFITSLFEL